jgi:hypothetical protein
MTKDRIVLLDSLRGLGVLGILLCNIPDFAVAPGVAESVEHWPHGAGPGTRGGLGGHAVAVPAQVRDPVLDAVRHLDLPGRRRAVRGRQDPILRKRLMWMVAFGLLHGFVIWYGDVLLSYALAGFAVMLARSWTPKRLIRTGATMWIGAVAAVRRRPGLHDVRAAQSGQGGSRSGQGGRQEQRRRRPICRDLHPVPGPEHQGPRRLPDGRAGDLHHDQRPDDGRPGLLQDRGLHRRGLEEDLCGSDDDRPDRPGRHGRSLHHRRPHRPAREPGQAGRLVPDRHRAADHAELCQPDGLRRAVDRASGRRSRPSWRRSARWPSPTI